jgi:hypothetical protein
MHLYILLPLVIFATGCSRSPQPAGVRAEARPAQPAKPASSPLSADFWKTWGDGQAELNGYDLVYPRYGTLRKGVAVAIFVTETFSKSARVKADPGRHEPSDEFPVMKLNLMRDYQTGVYDYNEMLSVFSALEGVDGRAFGLPSKISFSSQEWCGHVYSRLLFGPGRASHLSHSYFDGEADSTREIPLRYTTTSEDALLLWARGMAWPYSVGAQAKRVRMLTSLETSRAKHVPVEEVVVELTVDKQARQVKVPAGSFTVDVRSAKLPDGTVHRYFVETAAPHKIVKWEASTGERAELLGSDRMKYWQMNGEGGEQALKRLGLSYLRSSR